MDKKIEVIKDCINIVKPGYGNNITIDSDLIKDQILDSLEAINFLFELENNFPEKINKIDDDFSDFTVKALIELIK